MAEGERKNWRELCNNALQAKDPDELMKITQELKKALKHEEQVLRDFWEATRMNKPQATLGTITKPADISNPKEQLTKSSEATLEP
jgi:hypothetical protein